MIDPTNQNPSNISILKLTHTLLMENPKITHNRDDPRTRWETLDVLYIVILTIQDCILLEDLLV